MHDVAIPSKLVQDPWEKNVPGLGLGRDPERTPMLWDSSLNAGFSAATPWLPVPLDYQTANVQAQRHNPASILTLYHRLCALRRATPALAVGAYTAVEAHGEILAYMRTHAGRRFLVVMNLGPQPHTFVSGQVQLQGHIVLSTHLDRANEVVHHMITLRGNEGVIVMLA
jgi:alpha-glucosidase